MRYGWRTAVLAPCLALVSSACAGSSADVTSPPSAPPPAPPSSPPPTPPSGPPAANPPGIGTGARILFIGNSLTEGHDVPGMVAGLAAGAGLDWTVESQLLGGAGLQEHWERGTAQARIRDSRWDAVVLQQGPSSLPESRANLRQWTGEFDLLVRQSGGRSALYMVWPDLSRLAWFDRVRDSYALAARDVGGWFLPAGETWRAAWAEDPGLQLYGGDGFHPTVAGSWAAALTIFSGLSGLSPPDVQAPSGVDPATAERLRRATGEALERYADYVPEDAP